MPLGVKKIKRKLLLMKLVTALLLPETSVDFFPTIRLRGIFLKLSPQTGSLFWLWSEAWHTVAFAHSPFNLGDSWL